MEGLIRVPSVPIRGPLKAADRQQATSTEIGLSGEERSGHLIPSKDKGDGGGEH